MLNTTKKSNQIGETPALREKSSITKITLAFILLVCGMFSLTTAKAQSYCTCVASHPAGWCYIASNGHEKCMKVNHFPDGWRLGNSGVVSTPLTVSPNPVSNSATISFFIEQIQKVSIKIFDINGRLIAIVTDGIFDEGGHELTWSTENLNAGIYFLQLQSEEKQEMLKLIVAK